MSSEKQSLPPQLVEALNKKCLVPFIGSGVSKFANARKFPNWQETVNRLVSYAERLGRITKKDRREIKLLMETGNGGSEDFEAVTEFIRNRLPTDVYETFIDDNFFVDNPQKTKLDIYKSIFSFSPPLIITTNYDNLIEHAYARYFGKNMDVKSYNEPGAVQRRLLIQKKNLDPLLFKIHGDVRDQKSIVFSDSDYRSLLYEHKGYSTVLTSIFVTHTVIFLGFSMSDREIRSMLEAVRYSLQERSSPHYIVLSEDQVSDIQLLNWRDKFGLEAILYRKSKTHVGLKRTVELLANSYRSS